jgi:hypothetical protein
MEEENKAKQKDFLLKLGWILFIMLVCLVIGFLLYPKVVSAVVSWPLNKTETCTFFNKTTDCDSYWCNNFMENTTWDAASEVCIRTINNLTYINLTGNYTFNSNLTDNWTYSNFSEFQAWSKNYTDTNIMALRDNLVDRIDNRTSPAYSYSSSSSPQPWPWFTLPLVALIIMGGLIFLYTSQIKAKQFQKPKQFQRSFFNPGLEQPKQAAQPAQQASPAISEEQKKKEFAERMKVAREKKRLEREASEEEGETE